MASTRRGEGRTHTARISRQQRAHCASVLIVIACLAAPALAQDISFDPEITQEEFHQFAAAISDAIFVSPVDAGEENGLLGFEIGVAANAIEIDEEAAYWVRSVESDLISGGYLYVPRIIASKGLVFGNLHLSYAGVPDSDIRVLGGSLDVPVIRGGAVRPTLAVRGSYARLDGVEDLDLEMYGAQAVLSKGFGPVTPYLAGGIVRTKADGRVEEAGVTLTDEFDTERYTVGVRVSLLIPTIAVEASQGEERTYAAKISLGF